MSESTINRANNFDPTAYQPKEGELRLETQKLWFRLKHPTGRMVTRHLTLNEKLAIIEARVYLDNAGAEDSYIANSVGFAVRKQADLVGGYVKEAEDTAMTRALSTAGFGIQNAGFLAEPEAPKAKRSTKKVAAPAVEETPVQEVKAEEPETAPAVEVADATPVDETVTATAEEATATAAEPASVEEVKPVVTEIAPAGDGQPPVEDYKAKMSITEAIGTVVEFGALKGKTLGQIVKEDPKQIIWLRDSYKGPDNHLRAAAAYLLEQAGDKAA